jgi:hypothetical protein
MLNVYLYNVSVVPLFVIGVYTMTISVLLITASIELYIVYRLKFTK